MVPLLFFDPLCPRPYSAASLLEAGLAGTEASTVRIAEALDAWVAQHNRIHTEGRPARDIPVRATLWIPAASVKSTAEVRFWPYS